MRTWTAVARQIGQGDWITVLPNGLDTQVGEAGAVSLDGPAATDRAGPRVVAGPCDPDPGRGHG